MPGLPISQARGRTPVVSPINSEKLFLGCVGHNMAMTLTIRE